jgi:hypothetical protein
LCVSIHHLFALPDFFSDFTTGSEVELEQSAKLGGSGGYGPVKAEMEIGASTTSKIKSTTQNVIASMTIERYYSSVKEEVSPLAEDAFTLLQSQDYIGFFKACGPNYVRSIRRVQEVHAIFKFTSTSTEIAASFVSSLKVVTPAGGGGAGASASSKFNGITSSLQITILGFGMGLTSEGSETMVATSMEEYKNVMIYSFKSFTQNEDSHNVGMVYGMEVVPWVNNVAFQAAAKVDSEIVEVPIHRSMIARAYQIDPAGTAAWSESARDDFKCKSNGYVIDKFGYCCEPLQLYHPTTQEYPGDVENCALETCICQPITNLDKSILKDNLANNGEFVARIDSAMRYKLVTLGVVEKCISVLRSIPASYDYKILKTNDGVNFNKESSLGMSVAHMRKAMDPLDDYGLLAQLSREMDEWIEMFYSTCLSALFGMNVGVTSSTDVSFIMAYPWHSHDECMKLSCLTTGFRWDRHTGNCIPGIIAGYGVQGYTGTSLTEDYCAKDDEIYDVETCKYPSDKMHRYHDSATNCWEHLPFTGIDYLITHYCNPVMTSAELDGDTIAELNSNVTTHCGGDSYNL